MIFKILYSLYLVVSLFYGTVPIMGTISVRHFLTIVMLGVCYLEGGLKIDRFLKWYMLFLLFYVIVEAGSGYSSYVFGKILGTYLASIVLYLATKVVIEKYNAEHLIINILVILGLINSIEVIGQYFGSPIALALPQILHIPMSEEDIELFTESETPLQYVAGLMGVVASGYYLSAISVLALYNKKDKITILNWAAFAIIFFALFLVQERSGVIAGIICTILYFSFVSIREQRNLTNAIWVCMVAIIITSVYASQIVSIENMRYSSVGMSDAKRVDIAANAINWVLHNPIGGANYFYDMGGYYPHNFFALALLYGGIIGGIVVICILFAQMIKISIVFTSYLRRSAYTTLLLATCLAYLCYTLNSFFHNYSLVTGGEMIFLLWAMIGSLKDIEDDTSYDIDLDTEELDRDLMMEK